MVFQSLNSFTLTKHPFELQFSRPYTFPSDTMLMNHEKAISSDKLNLNLCNGKLEK